MTISEPAQARSFASLGLPASLLAPLSGRGITAPRPIQAETIADALAGLDVCGRAPTGSGKTLAFSLPMAARVGRSSPRRPRGLVLAPTRELAAQITGELDPLLRTRGLAAHAFFGGVGFGPQLDALRKGTAVAVACPGRLEDLIARRAISLQDVEMVVVDEADRMADMGFLPAVRRILDATPADRQTLLFSATLDGDVDVLIRRYQRDPVRHEVSDTVETAGPVTHRFHAVERADRVAACVELATGLDSSIIFVRTKHGADRLARQLSGHGLAADAIHGGRSQRQRERSLENFRSGRIRALVATDLAARGIHVDGVSGVIHYDLPADAKDYIHRSGRTARAGASGSVIALVTEDQHGAARDLQREVGVAIDGTATLRSAAPAPAAAGRVPRRHDQTRPGSAPAPAASGERARRRRSGRR